MRLNSEYIDDESTSTYDSKENKFYQFRTYQGASDFKHFEITGFRVEIEKVGLPDLPIILDTHKADILDNIEKMKKAKEEKRKEQSEDEAKFQPMKNIFNQIVTGEQPLEDDLKIDEDEILAELKPIDDCHDVTLAIILKVMGN